MATTFFALLLAVFVPIIGLRFVLLRYAPSPMARQLRMLQLNVALQLFRDRILYLRRRELRALYPYRKCIRELQTAVILRDAFEKRAAAHGPKLELLARQTEEYAIIDRYYERKLRQAAAFLGEMSDEQLQAIATSIRDELLEGLVPVSTVADFLKEERQVIKESSHMAVGHYGRMTARMREIRKAILLSAIRGLAKRR